MEISQVFWIVGYLSEAGGVGVLVFTLWCGAIEGTTCIITAMDKLNLLGTVNDCQIQIDLAKCY